MGLKDNLEVLHQLNYTLFGIEKEDEKNENRAVIKGLVENIINHIIANNIIAPSTKTGDGKPVVGKII